MNQSYKPEGYSSVSAYIIADNAQNVIDFLTNTFAANEIRRYTRPDGSIMHSEVKIDDSVIMISDSTDDYPAFQIWLHVYVADVDTTYSRALEAGGVSVEKPNQKKDDPDRRAGVKGPEGNIWWIGTQTN